MESKQEPNGRDSITEGRKRGKTGIGGKKTAKTNKEREERNRFVE